MTGPTRLSQMSVRNTPPPPTHEGHHRRGTSPTAALPCVFGWSAASTPPPPSPSHAPHGRANAPCGRPHGAHGGRPSHTRRALCPGGQHITGNAVVTTSVLAWGQEKLPFPWTVWRRQTRVAAKEVCGAVAVGRGRGGARGGGGATTTGPDATPPPPSYLPKLGGGGSLGGGVRLRGGVGEVPKVEGPAHNPLLPHAHLQGGCVSGGLGVQRYVCDKSASPC